MIPISILTALLLLRTSGLSYHPVKHLFYGKYESALALLGGRLCQDEAGYLLSSHQLSDTNWNRLWTQTVHSMRSSRPQKQLLMLRVKDGKDLWSKSGVGTTTQVFQETRYPDPSQVCTCPWAERSCYRQRRTGKGKFKSVCGCHPECSQLGYFVKKGEKDYSWTDRYCVSVVGAQKS